MDLVNATLKLYKEAVVASFGVIRRHPFKPLFGVLYLLAIGLIEGMVSQLQGFAGGMVRGLVITALLANFLAFITLMADSKKFGWQELWGRTWVVFSPLINSLFILFLAQFLLGPILSRPGSGFLGGAVNLALLVLFNPMPEIVAVRGSGGLEAFKDSLEFMKENGPEWLLALLLILLPLAFLLGPVVLLFILASTDPLSGIFILFRWTLSAFFNFGGAYSRLLLMVVGLYYLFLIFQIRLYLFEKLSTSTRRKRIYALRN